MIFYLLFRQLLAIFLTPPISDVDSLSTTDKSRSSFCLNSSSNYAVGSAFCAPILYFANMQSNCFCNSSFCSLNILRDNSATIVSKPTFSCTIFRIFAAYFLSTFCKLNLSEFSRSITTLSISVLISSLLSIARTWIYFIVLITSACYISILPSLI